MSVELVYHSEDSRTSPFDVRAIEIARDAATSRTELRIACPYLSLDYILRLTAISNSWLLLTDIEEWLASLVSSERKTAWNFIVQNEKSIHHSSGLHAKVLIGGRKAMIGSANFTTSGIQRRTEMAVFIQDDIHHRELVEWFQHVWQGGCAVPVDKLADHVSSLPERTCLQRSSILQGGIQREAPLMVLEKVRTILVYQKARGYYTGNGGRFCVLEGSKAKGYVSPSFIKNSRGRYNQLRETLIQHGVLTRNHEWEDFSFSKDYVFSAPSPAACIVDGNARSGPGCWKEA